MAAFYIDNDVSLRFAIHLRGRGHQVVTAADLGLAEAKDPIQLLTAAQHRSVLLTHNRKDFVLLHEAWQSWPSPWGVTTPIPHSGILVIPQPLPPDMADAIEQFLTSHYSWENQLFRWRLSDDWSRWQLGSTWVPILNP